MRRRNTRGAWLGVCLWAMSCVWAQPSPVEPIRRALPDWVKFSGEERVRMEGYSAQLYRPTTDNLYLAQRLRLNLTLAPKWTWQGVGGKILAQGQDSRVFWRTQKPAPTSLQDTWDLRQAYAEFGDPGKSPWALRFGRQELIFGDERLIGQATWSNTGRTFDAARLTLHHGPLRLDAFASSVVVLHDGEVGSRDAGNNLHGLYGGITDVIPHSVIEPYFLWRLQPRVTTELGGVGNSDMKVTGVRWAGRVAALDYTSEFVFERGHVLRDQIAAHALRGILGYTVKVSQGTLRPMLEYNFASGDGNAHDGHRNTFDQLYPSSHDKLGLADQNGWRNIHDLRGGLEWKPQPKLTLSVRYHAFWLADPHDALYIAQGGVIVQRADGSAGRWVGQEIDLVGSYAVTKGSQLGLGLSHIFPGTFLRLTTPGHSFTAPYLMLGTQF